MFVKLHKLVNKLSCAIFELRGQHCLECSDYAKVTLFVWIPRLLPQQKKDSCHLKQSSSLYLFRSCKISVRILVRLIIS